MYHEHTIGVVIPAYNEEGYVGEVIETLPSFVDRTYVIDDGSTDDTWLEITEYATEYNATHPGTNGYDARVVPIQHKVNRGVGGAIKTGYLQALEDGIDVTAVMGGDGQMDPDVLTKFIDPVVEGKAHYAKGNRFMKFETLDAMPRFRLFGNTLLSLLTKVSSGYWSISDPQNGYTAISQEALQRVDIDGMYEYYGYCNDLLVRLNLADCRVADVVHSAETVYGEDWKSHINYSAYVPKVSYMLLHRFLWRLNQKYILKDFRPFAAAYYLGAGVTGLGIAKLMAKLAFRRENTDSWFFTLLSGIVLILSAMVLDRMENEDMGVQVREAPTSLPTTSISKNGRTETGPIPADDD